MKQHGQGGGSACAKSSGLRSSARAVLLWAVCCGQPVRLLSQDLPRPIMPPPSPVLEPPPPIIPPPLPVLDPPPPTEDLSVDDTLVLVPSEQLTESATNAPAVGTGDVVRAVWRDPFWPVGYTGRKALPRPVATAPTPQVPQAPAAPSWVEDWTAAQKKLVVSGISGGGQAKGFMAIINGRLVTPGSTVSVTLDGVTYFWRVETVQREGPTYTRVRAEAASP